MDISNNKNRIEEIKEKIKSFQNSEKKETPMEKIQRLKEQYKNFQYIRISIYRG